LSPDRSTKIRIWAGLKCHDRTPVVPSLQNQVLMLANRLRCRFRRLLVLARPARAAGRVPDRAQRSAAARRPGRLPRQPVRRRQLVADLRGRRARQHLSVAEPERRFDAPGPEKLPERSGSACARRTRAGSVAALHLLDVLLGVRVPRAAARAGVGVDLRSHHRRGALA